MGSKLNFNNLSFYSHKKVIFTRIAAKLFLLFAQHSSPNEFIPLFDLKNIFNFTNRHNNKGESKKYETLLLRVCYIPQDE